MKPKTVDELHKYVGQLVKITFYDDKIKHGRLGFTKEFSAEYDYRKPGYFTIENLDFKLSHIKQLEVEENGCR